MLHIKLTSCSDQMLLAPVVIRHVGSDVIRTLPTTARCATTSAINGQEPTVWCSIDLLASAWVKASTQEWRKPYLEKREDHGEIRSHHCDECFPDALGSC